jgi:hypothetical protein
MSMMSAWRVTAQKGSQLSVSQRQIGASRRSCVQASWGWPFLP